MCFSTDVRLDLNSSVCDRCAAILRVRPFKVFLAASLRRKRSDFVSATSLIM